MKIKHTNSSVLRFRNGCSYSATDTVVINKKIFSRYRFFSILLLVLCSGGIIGCKTKKGINEKSTEDSKDILLKQKPSELNVLAFGSCNRITLPQDIWPTISKHQPDLWMWLGDIIYADTENMQRMNAMYKAQKEAPNYQSFLQKHAVIGIWDDHDYGQNDGGKSYCKKEESKVELLRFLDVPSDNPVWKRKGAYQSYTFGEAGKRVKVILLDTRYFRDRLRKDIVGKNRYFVNKRGDILGEKQWKWLEKELRQSDAQVHLIGSSIQVIPTEHPFEKWSNFPKERLRLFKLLQKIKPTKAILLSGDRHISEVSKIDLKGLSYPLYEVTSSSLTHAYEKKDGEPNQYRIGKLVDVNNFALLKFDWGEEEVGVRLEIRGVGDELLEEAELF